MDCATAPSFQIQLISVRQGVQLTHVWPGAHPKGTKWGVPHISLDLLHCGLIPESISAQPRPPWGESLQTGLFYLFLGEGSCCLPTHTH
jgi:hypothetical protein